MGFEWCFGTFVLGLCVRAGASDCRCRKHRLDPTLISDSAQESHSGGVRPVAFPTRSVRRASGLVQTRLAPLFHMAGTNFWNALDRPSNSSQTHTQLLGDSPVRKPLLAEHDNLVPVKNLLWPVRWKIPAGPADNAFAHPPSGIVLLVAEASRLCPLPD